MSKHIDPSQAGPLVQIVGDEQGRIDERLADGGLPPAAGVQSWQVFRASRDAVELTDGRGWTYHHHVDMACWRGRLYVAWNTCERDEDVWPSRELFSTSADGADWSSPRELFPQGVSTPLRMYFFLAPVGRMLAVAGLRVDTADTSEDRKGGLVVREIRADHGLGAVFTLQAAGGEAGADGRPAFETSGDEGFVTACRQLLADRVFLEQQDCGRLLGDRRMKWHDAAAWPEGHVPGDNEKWVCGKAYSFFRRADGVRVGISKMGWTTSTTDDGETWSRPCVPPTLVTGKAKVWSQRTDDGRYTLVYNPSTRQRYPLVMVTSEDGCTFGGMRVVQGELPIQRYTGKFRSIGPQYVRGVSEWSDDGSRRGEGAMWLVYSMSKEDIWVSRVPLAVGADEVVEDRLDERPAGVVVEGWNTYAPKWGEVGIVGNGDGALRLESRDPYDYAQAMRVFGSRGGVRVSLDLLVRREPVAGVEVDLVSTFGSRRAVRLRLECDGVLSFAGPDAGRPLCRMDLNRWARLTVEAEAGRGRCSVWVEGVRVATDVPFAEPAEDLHRLVVRTGRYRGVGGTCPVAAGSDVPTAATVVEIRRLTVGAVGGS